MTAAPDSSTGAPDAGELSRPELVTIDTAVRALSAMVEATISEPAKNRGTRRTTRKRP